MTPTNEFREKLQIAASFDTDKSLTSLTHHLGYRKRVAEEILGNIDPEKMREHALLYESVDNMIKKMLGI